MKGICLLLFKVGGQRSRSYCHIVGKSCRQDTEWTTCSRIKQLGTMITMMKAEWPYNLVRLITMISLFVILFGVLRPTLEFFNPMETTPLPMNGCKFWPILGCLGHWAVRGFHVLWHGTSVYNGYLLGPVTLAPIADRLAVELDSNIQPSTHAMRTL